VDKKNVEKVSEGKLGGLRVLGRPSVYMRMLLKWISNKMEVQRLVVEE